MGCEEVKVKAVIHGLPRTQRPHHIVGLDLLVPVSRIVFLLAEQKGCDALGEIGILSHFLGDAGNADDRYYGPVVRKWQVHALLGAVEAVVFHDLNRLPFLCGAVPDFMVGADPLGVRARKYAAVRPNEVHIVPADIFHAVHNLLGCLFADFRHILVLRTKNCVYSIALLVL